MSSDPEGDLEQFLVTLPACIRKEFESGVASLTQDELYERLKVDVATHQRFLEEYRRLLWCIPARWSKYRNRESAAWAQLLMPANPGGRPRKDALATEVLQLKKAGLSHAQIAKRINLKHGKESATAESIRGLLKSRRRESNKLLPPDKT